MRWLAVLAVGLTTTTRLAVADHLVLTSGRTFEGQVLQENDSTLTFRLDHGVITIPKENIGSIDRTPPKPLVKPAAPNGQSAPVVKRMPSWKAVTSALARQRWASNLSEIPATVIDKGQMRFVPYSSYRCGEDYEVNIYGDPDAPAGIEIGVYRKLLRDDNAKANCISFIAEVLTDPADGAIVKTLNRRKDIATHAGLTIEVTPETDEDAYGGWWISVYDEKALDAARATPKEIDQISVAKVDPQPASARQAVPSQKSSTSAPTIASDTLTDWAPTDMGNARPSTAASYGGGRVYVRGYYRKDGVYVSPHTRAAPGYGGGRRGR